MCEDDIAEIQLRNDGLHRITAGEGEGSAWIRDMCVSKKDGHDRTR